MSTLLVKPTRSATTTPYLKVPSRDESFTWLFWRIICPLIAIKDIYQAIRGTSPELKLKRVASKLQTNQLSELGKEILSKVNNSCNLMIGCKLLSNLAGMFNWAVIISCVILMALHKYTFIHALVVIFTCVGLSTPAGLVIIFGLAALAVLGVAYVHKRGCRWFKSNDDVEKRFFRNQWVAHVAPAEDLTSLSQSNLVSYKNGQISQLSVVNAAS